MEKGDLNPLKFLETEQASLETLYQLFTKANNKQHSIQFCFRLVPKIPLHEIQWNWRQLCGIQTIIQTWGQVLACGENVDVPIWSFIFYIAGNDKNYPFYTYTI